MNRRELAVEAYVRALKGGEAPAVENLAQYLAPDMVLLGASSKQTPRLEGAEQVLYGVTGGWPNTAAYAMGYWSKPKAHEDKLKVSATFPPLGSSPAAVNLTFSFDSEDRISEIAQEIVPQAAATVTNTIPDSARGMINSALATNKPMALSYVDETGKPRLSIRGSIQVYSPTQIAVWVRNKASSLTGAIAKNPNVSLLYRDNATRSTLMIQGTGQIEYAEDVCDRVWNMIPDVEQKHETRESGCALIVDVESMVGNSPAGGVRMQRG